jgi:predicted dehydrogenase
MPGEYVAELYQGPMRDETFHFIECVAYGRQVLVTPEEARRVMEVTLAADLSAGQQRPIDLPLPPA